MASRPTDDSGSGGSFQNPGYGASDKVPDDIALADRCNSVVREIELLENYLTKTQHRLRKARNTTRRGRLRLSRLAAERNLRSAPQLELGETVLAQAVLTAQQRAKSDPQAVRPILKKLMEVSAYKA